MISGNAEKEFFDFVTKTNIPVATTILGQGIFPQNHPLCLGMLGMHGNYTANTAMTQSDLVIAIGARFDDRVTGKVDDFLAQAKIIHIDIDQSSLEKIKEVDLKILSDAKTFLKAITKIAKPLQLKNWQTQFEKNAARFSFSELFDNPRKCSKFLLLK